MKTVWFALPRWNLFAKCKLTTSALLLILCGKDVSNLWYINDQDGCIKFFELPCRKKDTIPDTFPLQYLWRKSHKRSNNYYLSSHNVPVSKNRCNPDTLQTSCIHAVIETSKQYQGKKEWTNEHHPTPPQISQETRPSPWMCTPLRLWESIAEVRQSRGTGWYRSGTTLTRFDLPLLL
jgi:hypothetical protein